MRTPDKTQLLKMAQHVFRRGQGVPDKRLLHPRREWGIGIVVFAIILIVGSVLNAQSFTRFRSIDLSQGEVTVETPRYNQLQVTEVLDQYRVRKASYQKLINSMIATPVSDTSSTTVQSASSTDVMNDDISGDTATSSVSG